MSTIDRREMLRRAGGVPLAGLALTGGQVEAAHEHVAKAKAAAAAGRSAAYEPRFFGAEEWAAVRVLADMVIPADERSGSATDALVPEFIDAIATDALAEPREREEIQTRLRGGLRWLDRETRARFGKGFAECAEGERKAVLDAIAWPEHVAPGLEPGAAFFTLFRDLVASGFWSSKAGFEDLDFRGNTFVAEWTGCPAEVTSRIGSREDPSGGGRR